MEYVTLNTGAKMPLEGFGVYQIDDLKVCEDSTYYAIKTGYRLIDTAAAYKNETAVGNAVKRAIADGLVKREDLFIVTKLWVQDMKTEDSAYAAVKTSLAKLQMDYVDLILLHQPFGDYFAAYRGIERAYKDGLARALGVSNFYPALLSNICDLVTIKPAVNQVEMHPYFQQGKAVENMRAHNVQPMSWAPLAECLLNILQDPELNEIAKKHGKTVPQIILRWNTQRGVVIIPKSTHEERIAENLNIWDFRLTDEEMEVIAKKDVGHSQFVDHSGAEFYDLISKYKIHD